MVTSASQCTRHADLPRPRRPGNAIRRASTPFRGARDVPGGTQAETQWARRVAPLRRAVGRSPLERLDAQLVQPAQIVPVATGAPRRSVSLAPRLAAAPSEGLRWGAFAYAPRTHLTVLLSGPTLVGTKAGGSARSVVKSLMRGARRPRAAVTRNATPAISVATPPSPSPRPRAGYTTVTGPTTSAGPISLAATAMTPIFSRIAPPLPRC